MADPEEEGYVDRLDEGIGPQLEEWRLAERQARWDSLLEARLQSTESITDWVEQVLQASDLGYDRHEGQSSSHSTSIENGTATSTDQRPKEDSNEESEEETGEHVTNGGNSSSDGTDSEINERNGISDTSDHQMTNVDSSMRTTETQSCESRSTGATNTATDNRGQFDDASTSSDDSVDLRANKHHMASN